MNLVADVSWPVEDDKIVQSIGSRAPGVRVRRGGTCRGTWTVPSHAAAIVHPYTQRPGWRWTWRRPQDLATLGQYPDLDDLGYRVLQRLERERVLRPGVADTYYDYQRETLGFAAFESEPHLWLPCGGGKTRVSLAWLRSVPGACVFVTRVALTIKVQREYEALFNGLAHVWKPPSRRKKGYIDTATYLELCADARETPFVVVGQENLVDALSDLQKVPVVSIAFDEIHRLASWKRWEASMRVDDDEDAPDRPNASTGQRSGFSVASRGGVGVDFSLKENIAAAAYELSRLGKRRVGLTATPIPDRVRNLWAPLDLVGPRNWGKFYDFATRYCTPAYAPIWMGNFDFKPICDVQVGDEVVGWARDPSKVAMSKTSDVDAQHRQNRLVIATVTAVYHLPPAPLVRVTMESGRAVICTADHRWLRADKWAASDAEYGYVTPKVGRRLCHIVDSTLPAPLSPASSRTAGWVAGMYDGEGSRDFIAQSSRANPETWAALHEALEALDIPHTMKPDSAACAGGAYITGGRDGLLRFYRKCRPVRFVRSAAAVVLSGKIRRNPDRIVSIEDAGVEPVYALTTTTGNYVAFGYASKNCAARPGAFGGIDTTGTSNLSELQDRLEWVAWNIPLSRVQASLPPFTEDVVWLTADNLTEPLGGWQRELKRAGREGGEALLEAHLAMTASRKRRWVVGQVIDALKCGMKVLVFSGRRRDVDEIAAAVRQNAEAGWYVDGCHGGSDDLQSYVDAYMAAEGSACLVATYDSIGDGQDLQDTDLCLATMLPPSPVKVTQMKGRVSRPGQKRPVLFRWCVAQGTYDEKVLGILAPKLGVVSGLMGDEAATMSDRVLRSVDDQGALLEELAAVVAASGSWTIDEDEDT